MRAPAARKLPIIPIAEFEEAWLENPVANKRFNRPLKTNLKKEKENVKSLKLNVEMEKKQVSVEQNTVKK